MVNSPPGSGPRTRRECRCPRARHQHGTRRAYQADRCRCFACRVAHARAHSRWRAEGSGADSVWLHRAGTIRRLQALAVLGWSDARVGARIGVTKQAVQNLRSREGLPILLATAERVAEVYDELWNVRAIGQGSTRCRIRAQGLGWLPPLAWDDDTIDDPMSKPEKDGAAAITHIGYPDGIPSGIDEIAVERAMRGDRVPLTKAEKSEAHARLNGMGLSARMIADRLGTTSRTVTRRRASAA